MDFERIGRVVSLWKEGELETCGQGFTPMSPPPSMNEWKDGEYSPRQFKWKDIPFTTKLLHQAIELIMIQVVSLLVIEVMPTENTMIPSRSDFETCSEAELSVKYSKCNFNFTWRFWVKTANAGMKG
jgi:hypothetical protein